MDLCHNIHHKDITMEEVQTSLQNTHQVVAQSCAIEVGSTKRECSYSPMYLIQFS